MCRHCCMFFSEGQNCSVTMESLRGQESKQRQRRRSVRKSTRFSSNDKIHCALLYTCHICKKKTRVSGASRDIKTGATSAKKKALKRKAMTSTLSPLFVRPAADAQSSFFKKQCDDVNTASQLQSNLLKRKLRGDDPTVSSQEPTSPESKTPRKSNKQEESKETISSVYDLFQSF